MMMMKIQTLCFVLLLLFAVFETRHCRSLEEEQEEAMMNNMRNHLLIGGVHDLNKGSQNDAVDIDSIGRFAVQEHNKKENSLIEFARVIKAKEQVVAGTIYHLTLEAIDAGKKKIYEAKVWVKPWMNFKQLQEFKHADDVPSSTPSHVNVN